MREQFTRRRVRAVALIGALGVAGSALLTSPSASAATERWVDAAATSATPGSGCGTDAGYTTIQAAITAAVAGDTINVCAGTYAGPITINKSNLVLKGAKAGVPAGPSATGNNRGGGESIIEANAAAVVTYAGSTTVNTVLDGFTIRNLDRHGINNFTGSGHQVINNIITHDPATRPVDLPAQNAQQSGILSGTFNAVTMKGNHITGFRYGFNLQSGNLTHAPSVIEDNYVGDYLVSGLVFGNNTADGQTVRGNAFAPSALASGPAGMSAPTMPLLISGNSFTGNGTGTGIFFVAGARSGIVIEGNTVTNWGRGISHPNIAATWPAGSTPTEVHQNNITNNGTTTGGYGLFNSTLPGEYDVNASCNWWGAATGPRTTFAGPGDRVSTGVSYTPWLITAAPSSECNGGLLNPTAEFTPSTTAGDAPLPVDFDASASNDQDGTIVSYAWDFGDGNVGTGVTTSHTYATPGSYVVTLTVTDNHGRTGQASATITVNQPMAAPTAVATATPGTGPAPLAVVLDGSGSSDSDGTIVSYAWDLGDGNNATGPVVSHVYTTPGTYVATLTITDNHGLTATAQVSIQVNPVPQPQTDADCKKNGWQAYGFRNQGQCIRYVNTGKDDRIGQ